MKRNKRKPQEFKKPFLVLNRRKMAGWFVVIFLSWALMFVIGVLVGRDTAPIKFDLENLRVEHPYTEQKQEETKQGGLSGDTATMKDKTKLGFYERLPEDRKEKSVADPAGQVKDAQKPKPKAKDSKKVAATAKKAAGATYTVQAASFKKAEDADKLLARLKKKGFPAYRTLGKVPQKGIWFRIRVGNYGTRSEANQTLNKLRKLGLKPIVVKQQ
jgi:cell division protein FtsN